MFNLKTSTTMTLVKRNNSLFPAFSSMFDDFFTNDFALKNTSLATVPAVNIREDENGFAVELAAPGKQKSDFQINLEHNVLSISSESKQENEEKDEKGRYTRREFSYSSFQRSFVLPNSVDGDKISATYENGVLHIQIPKKEEVKKKPTRTIEIA
ncbi:MAG: Hsp20/alpha crystallin family protein [Raineya sp.]